MDDLHTIPAALRLAGLQMYTDVARPSAAPPGKPQAQKNLPKQVFFSSSAKT
ncbi:Uncharacterised protein [Kluyvera intermedia]|jgi:hypothetical protein|nr:Uncharacterised protein [Kluyvera intermedia]